MPTISLVADVRAEGVLADATATGAVTDEQIDGAIVQAFQEMMILFPLADYEAVRIYAGVDAALLEKQNRFKHAECSFALSELMPILSTGQFVQGGFAKQKSVGQSKIDLASPQDIADAQANWYHKAIVWLRPYLSTKVLNEKGKQKAFRTKDRKLTMIAI